MNRIAMVFAGVVLAVATLWAFGGSDRPAAIVAGQQVGPTEAYNPVLAGDPLPDGFRQLLPRDAIAPIYDPQFVDGDVAGWPGNAQVIGVSSGDRAKAYPVSFLTSREIVVDELDGIPILVTW